MKVTLVYPNILPTLELYAHDYEGHYSHAITRDIGKDEFCEQVRKENPDLLAFTCTSNLFPLVERMLSYLRQQNINILTICGGPHVTLNPQEVIKNSGIDIACIGEGEEALVSLCSKLEKDEDYSRINNLWVTWKGEVIKNPLSPYIDLNKLPFPDRNIFPNFQKLFLERHGRASVMVSRGCPYNCSYCCNHALKNVQGARNYIRHRSVKLVMDELTTILADFSFIDSFQFDDDILTLDKKWLYEFSSIYRKKIMRPYSCNIRPNLITEEVVKMLAESGCDLVTLGLESGNESIRNKVLNRGLSDETMVKAFKLCKAAGLKIHTNNIVGIPFESPSAALDTIKMNARIEPDSLESCIFYPYKNTTLYDICKKENFLTERVNVDVYTDSILSLPDQSREQIIMFRAYFRRFVELYKVIFKFNGKTGRYGIQWIDKILSLKSTAWILTRLYHVLFWLWLKVTKRRYKPWFYSKTVKSSDE
jgi:radical SAM superfamily enzyme YgiQ (UPF0313 family)